jgi:DNA-binding CsgD family transcriptional regulator
VTELTQEQRPTVLQALRKNRLLRGDFCGSGRPSPLPLAVGRRYGERLMSSRREPGGLPSGPATLPGSGRDTGRVAQESSGTPGPGAARVLLGGRCFFEDDFDGARLHWEHAFRLFRESGDLRAAARTAADLAGLHWSVWGHRSVGQGWVDRGLRLARRCGPCVEEGYLALAVPGCDQPDVEAVARAAESALALAVEFSDHVLEVRALAEWGFALVAQGHLAEGFARLDEAMAAVTGGEIGDAGQAGKCYCAMLSACDRSGEVRRAQEWTAVVSQFLAGHDGGPRIIATHCRGVYGSVLSRVGRWPEAETAMLEALAPEASQALNHQVETTARLAELWLWQGRLSEVEALLAPFEDCLDCCAPLARLHLAQGEPALAAAVIQRGLEEQVGDRVRASSLLGLLVQAGLAAAQPEAAIAAAERLAAIAGESDAPLLRVDAALAGARVAAAGGEHQRAIVLLGQAQQILDEVGSPLLAGLVHLERAQVCAGSEPATAVSEARAALAVFERLGADREADRAAALLRSLGDRSRARRAGTTISVLSTREQEVLDLVRQGLSNAAIAKRLYISPKTAEHHVSSVLAKLGVRSRNEAAALASGSHPGS